MKLSKVMGMLICCFGLTMTVGCGPTRVEVPPDEVDSSNLGSEGVVENDEDSGS